MSSITNDNKRADDELTQLIGWLPLFPKFDGIPQQLSLSTTTQEDVFMTHKYIEMGLILSFDWLVD